MQNEPSNVWKMCKEWCPKQHIKTPAPSTWNFFYGGFNPLEIFFFANISLNMHFWEKNFKPKLFHIKFPID